MHRVCPTTQPNGDARLVYGTGMHRVLRTTIILLFGAVFAAEGLTQSPGEGPESFTGKWSGSFEITPPDGKVVHDTAVLILKQSGAVVTGSIGQTEDKQSAFTDGTADGRKLQFTLDSGEGMHLDFHLSLVAGHLKGSASGTLQGGVVNATIDALPMSSKNPTIVSPEQELFNQVARLDKAMFDAYNRRDLAALKTMFTEDLEFYHDKSGLMSYRQSMESFKKNFQGQTRMRRQLVAGSLEVYPIAGYGAVEIGVHRFYSTEPNQTEKLTATAKFVHVWKKAKGAWKIARVVSYDHQ